MSTTRRDARSPRVSRRDLLRFGAAGAGIAALGPLGRFLPEARGAPRDLTRFVVVNAFGGNDTLNMVVPVTLPNYFSRRPGLAVEESDALSLAVGANPTTTYRLHPELHRIRGLWEDGDVALVQRVGYPNANLSHFSSQDIWSEGVRDGFDDLGIPESGWIARYADLYAPTALGAVSVGVGRPKDFVGGTSNPLLVKSLGSFKLDVDRRYDENHELRIETARRILARHGVEGRTGGAKLALEQAHDLAGRIQTAVEGYADTVTYEDTRPARYLRDVAILIEGGFETRLFFTGYGGFDTHSDQGVLTGRHSRLLRDLDDGIGAFAEDMKRLGVWDDMAIAVVTEFGRRNFRNGSSGTDHGHAFCEMLVGGAVNGGTYGPDLVEADIERNYPDYEVDFRSIYKEVLENHLDADPDPVFPEPLEKNVVLGVV